MKTTFGYILASLFLSSFSWADPDCSGIDFGNGSISCDHYYMVPAHAGLVGFYKEVISSNPGCNEDSYTYAFDRFHETWVPHMQAKCEFEHGTVGWHNESCEIDEMVEFDKNLFQHLREGFHVRGCFVEKQTLTPGFNCDQKLGAVEEWICEDQYLAIYDQRLNDYYTAEISSQDATEEAKENQMKWLAKTNKCASKHCLLYLYFHRINDFKEKDDSLW